MERKPFQWLVRFALILTVLSIVSLVLTAPGTAEFTISLLTLGINLVLLIVAMIRLRKEPPHDPH